MPALAAGSWLSPSRGHWGQGRALQGHGDTSRASCAGTGQGCKGTGVAPALLCWGQGELAVSWGNQVPLPPIWLCCGTIRSRRSWSPLSRRTVTPNHDGTQKWVLFPQTTPLWVHTMTRSVPHAKKCPPSPSRDDFPIFQYSLSPLCCSAESQQMDPCCAQRKFTEMPQSQEKWSVSTFSRLSSPREGGGEQSPPQGRTFLTCSPPGTRGATSLMQWCQKSPISTQNLIWAVNLDNSEQQELSLTFHPVQS